MMIEMMKVNANQQSVIATIALAQFALEALQRIAANGSKIKANDLENLIDLHIDNFQIIHEFENNWHRYMFETHGDEFKIDNWGKAYGLDVSEKRFLTDTLEWIQQRGAESEHTESNIKRCLEILGKE